MVNFASGRDDTPFAAWQEQLAAARLNGVRLTAREINHRLNNHLTISLGALDILAGSADLSPDQRGLVDMAIGGIEAAAADLRRLRAVREIHVKETPAGPALDLDRSAGPPISAR